MTILTHQPLTVCGSKNIYLDHNATTPLALDIRNKLGEWAEVWGNPSSVHWEGRGPKALIRDARKDIARFINANSPLEVVFTSGGSESNNMALLGAYLKIQESEPHRKKVITTSVEHPSIIKTLKMMEERYDIKLIQIPVNREGTLDLEAYRSSLDESTALVSIMYANNETGTCFPITELGTMAKQVGALFHVDAVQALGKAPIDVQAWGVDLASFSAHKFYALKGCGYLYIKASTPVANLIYGGSQERGRRAGTENLLAIASAAEMVKYKDQIESESIKVGRLRDNMEKSIQSRISGVLIIGAGEKRVSNTSSLVIEGVNGESLLMNLDVRGFSVSAGSACSSGNPEPSPVLLAMGCSHKQAQSSLRVSLGWTTTADEMDQFVEALCEVVTFLRGVKE